MNNSLDQLRQLLPAEVNLLAVSKGHSESSIRFFANQGQRDFGESRLQEALPKISNLADLKLIRWHFIGRLQSNKVRGVIKNFDVIHSVDSLAIGERISRISVEESCCPQVLLQVKLLEDSSKGGFSKDELLNGWPKLINLPNFEISGLMTIPPIRLELQERKRLFKECRHLADTLGLKDCSMGMSRDWEEAVEAGSTWVRIGSHLFGDRDK